MLDKKTEEINNLRERNLHSLKLLSEDLRVYYESKMREQQRTLTQEYEKHINEYRVREEKWIKNEKKQMKQEIEKLQKQQFILRMRTLGRVIVQYKKD